LLPLSRQATHFSKDASAPLIWGAAGCCGAAGAAAAAAGAATGRLAAGLAAALARGAGALCTAARAGWWVAAAAGVPIANGVMVSAIPATVAGMRLAAASGVNLTEALPFFVRSVRAAQNAFGYSLFNGTRRRRPSCAARI
jgi:hypothetical protein